jgi:hypothetical protein
MVHHTGHLTFTPSKGFGHDADEFVGTVDDDGLDWFERSAVQASRDCLWFRHLQFVPFAPHHFNENGQLQFATTGNLELIGGFCLLHANGDIPEDFLVSTLFNLP